MCVQCVLGLPASHVSMAQSSSKIVQDKKNVAVGAFCRLICQFVVHIMRYKDDKRGFHVNAIQKI